MKLFRALRTNKMGRITKFGLLALTCLVLAGCAARGPLGKDPTAGFIPQTQVESDKAMQVYGWALYSNPLTWEASPWFRMSRDNSWDIPAYVAVNAVGYGCVVPAEVWALQPSWIVCPGNKWRHPRYDSRRR